MLLSSADGGIIGLVKDGDAIKIDIPNRKLELDIPEEEINKRKLEFVKPQPKELKGILKKYARRKNMWSYDWICIN
jgi:dihydroxy-acid dehydratase